ncbi:hypothetical protein FH609_019870 [Streptomyces sp. 3MP-14]|uniref:Uncharacterized protein n=1 Tax=Streptomyces mimosae TaxID=2586635 RepID=A0A5N5ZQW3_9ACTN|nr:MULTISPECIES: hypothetical protein [Streptomyces]KAB8158904.1 hypothetical protein FH607_028830 [Streptomyces mimosae]KAB8174856.1 hypothetical protein FH609_019870 [Streptomyces sp. 3MP-14]
MSKHSQETVERPSSKRRLALMAAVATAAMATMVAASPSHAETVRLAERPSSEGERAASEGEVPQTGEELVATLTELLPQELEITESEGFGLDEGPDVSASLVAEDGTGGTTFDLSAYRFATDDWREVAGCQGFGELEPGDNGFTCEDTELPDGSILSYVTWEFAEEDIEEPYHQRDWEIWVEGPGGESLEEPGGRTLVLTESKELSGLEDPDSYTPPVDFEQLAEAAQAPVWQQVFDAADEQWGPPEDWEDPSTDIPAAELRSTFRALAPEGLEIIDGTDDDPGRATLTVDDGNGPGLVDITTAGPVEGPEEPSAVTRLAPVDAADEPQCEDKELADGRLLSFCDWAASEDDPVALSWAVVTYPDGSALDITSWNSEDWESEPNRVDTPLGAVELAEIVIADEWQALFS